MPEHMAVVTSQSFASKIHSDHVYHVNDCFAAELDNALT